MPDKERPNVDARYIAEQRTVDVLNVLKKISDENHPVTKKMILEEVSTTDNPQTLSNTVDEILLQINPVEYDGENDHEYRIKYDGYDLPFEENPLVIKSEINELRKEKRRADANADEIQKELDKYSGGKAPNITNLRYIHDFSDSDMDTLISAVALSASIAPEEKERLIEKIMDTASMYYKSPFYDKANRKLKFNAYSEYSRIHTENGEYESRLANNIRILQQALLLRTKVKFHFDVYSEEKRFVSDDIVHVVSPYYIVIYHDNYYLIGAWDKKDCACHYRIDLMSNLEIMRDENEMPVPMKAISLCKDLPGREHGWNPAKYMSEHLYMSYDKPRKISIKIKTDDISRYTMLHDWFGDYFEKNKRASEKCEQGYEIVDVTTSPNMIVHWAMQYGERVEILDEEIREAISENLKGLSKKYRK